VRVLDFGVDGETPFLVMDYAPNESLRNQHPKGVLLPMPTIISYVKQVADALQYAHDNRIVHRDVNPENIPMGQRDEVLLSDFGLAIVEQSAYYQSKQHATGTALYMAPEQFRGKYHQ
jgi:serine/threonine protein kinase